MDPLRLAPADRTPAQAWAVAVEYRGLAVAFARRWRTRDVELADLAQEATIGLYEAARSYDPAHRHGLPFRGYALMPIRARVKMALDARRMRRTPGVPLLETDRATPAADAGIGDDERELVRAAVAGLPDPQRYVIQARYFEGRPVGTIAASLGVSIPSYHRIRREALARLREALG
jgi:RNA polymerase sigma-70 factor (ECF subfamily)